MDAAVKQSQVEWAVAAEDDWQGVYECGAIFRPDREMRFEINDDDWLIGSGCKFDDA